MILIESTSSYGKMAPQNMLRTRGFGDISETSQQKFGGMASRCLRCDLGADLGLELSQITLEYLGCHSEWVDEDP